MRSRRRSHTRWAAVMASLVCALALAGSVVPASLGAPSAAAPVFAQSVDVAPLKGKVTVSLPGHGPVALKAPRQVPLGTTVIAPSARDAVRVTASDGMGGTYSGRFGDGGFVVLQSASGGGASEIKVIGKCVKDTAGDVPVATAARRRPRHKAPLFRQLQVQANGRFEVIGSNASAVASGRAVYTLTDQCDGTHITAETGKVSAKGTIEGALTLHAHQTIVDDCQPSAAAPTECILLVGKPQSEAFSFGLLLVNGTASSFQLCYTTPKGHRFCRTGPLGPPNSPAEGGALACTVNDGPGDYTARWLVDGRQIGAAHHFKGTQRHDPVLGNDSCSGRVLDVNQ